MLDTDGLLKIYDKNLNAVYTVFTEKSNSIYINDYDLILTPFTSSNKRILQEDESVAVEKKATKKTTKQNAFDVAEAQYSNDYNTLNKYKELKGAIILIGSLYWDNNIKGTDNAREIWRNNFLEINKAKDLKFPIRYGRKSGKEGAYTYTMVVSNSPSYKKKDNLGTAKLIPLKCNYSVAEQVFQLTISEGFISQSKAKKAPQLKTFGGSSENPWGVIGYSINNMKGTPELINFKNDIQNIWERQIRDNNCLTKYPNNAKVKSITTDEDGVKVDSNTEEETENIPFDSKGSLVFLENEFWQNELLNGYDFVICTLAYPSTEYISFDEIAIKASAEINTSDYDLRQYFHNTKEKGIKTIGDERIKVLKNSLLPTHKSITKDNNGSYVIRENLSDQDL